MLQFKYVFCVFIRQYASNAAARISLHLYHTVFMYEKHNLTILLIVT